MFATDIATKALFPSGRSSKQALHWSRLSLVGQFPWFVVSYAKESPDGIHFETELLRIPEDVIALADRIGTPCLMQICLVSAPQQNVSARWEMHTLQKIWQARDPESGHTTIVCQTEDEQLFTDVMLDTPTEHLLLEQCLVSV